MLSNTMKNKWMISCDDATRLMAYREEKRMGLSTWLKLRVHTFLCVFCRRFEKQMKLLRRESRHLHSSEELKPEAREKIRNLLREKDS